MRHNILPFRRASVIPHGDTEPAGCNHNCQQCRMCDCVPDIEDGWSPVIGRDAFVAWLWMLGPTVIGVGGAALWFALS